MAAGLFSCQGGEAMPHKFKRPCAYPGCPRLTDGQYCEEHKRLVAKNYNMYQRDRDYRKRYNGSWRKIRQRYVKLHPLCERCLKEGRITPVEEVHHIIPLNRGGTNEESNLMSLCRSCHNKIHLEMGDRHMPRGH